MEKHYIYVTKNIINGKMYVGKHTYKGSDSYDKHYLGSGYILKRAIKKYGKENFTQEILEYNSSKEENAQREIYWIQKLNTLVPNGYNVDKGGTGGGVYLNSENSKFIQLYTWENYSPEERAQRVQKMKDGLNKPEVKKLIGEKSKEWHRSLTSEEKELLIQKQKDGWTEDARQAHKRMMSDYNKNFKMKDKLILKYGKELGEQKYIEWKEKVSNSIKSNKELQIKSKATIDAQKKAKSWPEYQKKKAQAQHLRCLFRKGLISEQDLNNQLDALKVDLKTLNAKVKQEVIDNERNNA